MDSLQKIIANGPVDYFLGNSDHDLEAWAVFNLLPRPQIEKNNEKFFFGIHELDCLLGGIKGLWEIHGKKSSGKTGLCKCLARETSLKVLYLACSSISCNEILEIVIKN
jgi:hypothetical protein